MNYIALAADLLPAVSLVAENAVLWIGGVLLVLQVCTLGLAAGGMMQTWRRRAWIQ